MSREDETERNTPNDTNGRPAGLPTGMDLHRMVLEAGRNLPDADAAEFIAQGAKYVNLTVGEVLMHRGCICIADPPTIEHLLVAAHDRVEHRGITSTLDRLRHVHWAGKDQMVRARVAACLTCQIENRAPRLKHGPMNVRPQPTRPWQTVCIDHIPMHGDGSGFAGILHIHCAFSRYGRFVAVPTLGAEHVVSALDDALYECGQFETLITDNHKSLTCELIKQWCNEHSIKPHPTHSYNPRANQAERTHAMIRKSLGILAGPDRSQWVSKLRRAAYIFNTSPNRSIGTTPFTLFYGRDPPSIAEPIPDRAGPHDALLLAEGLRANAARLSLWAAEINKLEFDKEAAEPFVVGDRVLLSTKAPSKQHPILEGPYTVTGTIRDRTGYYLITKYDIVEGITKPTTIDVQQDRLYRFNDGWEGQEYNAPIDRGEHEIKTVIAERMTNGVRQLRIRWEGGNASNDTWEPVSGKHKNRSVCNTAIVKEYLQAMNEVTQPD